MKPRAPHPRHGCLNIGLVEWFRPGEYERVESVLTQICARGQFTKCELASAGRTGTPRKAMAGMRGCCRGWPRR